MVLAMLFVRTNAAYAMTNSEIRTQIISRLYKSAGGRMSCDYDGYTTTSGRHEGIDFVSSAGTPIYAVFSGKVTGNGVSSTGVTVLAVYNSDYNVTIVYEHANFSVSVGTSVGVGTQLGVEASRGTQSAHTHFELRTGYHTGGASNRNSTLENPNPYPYYAKMFGGIIPDPHTIDSAYPTPITAVPRATTGNIQVYDIEGNAESGRWISAGDLCTIMAVYTDGWMQVNYPTSSGDRTAYVKKDVFFASNSIINSSWSPSVNVTSYKYADLTGQFGSVFSTDKCVVVGQSGSNNQAIYPISGGYKLGWVSSSGGYVPPTPDPIPDPISVPGPVAAGVFDGKQIVVMAPHKISFSSSEYISAGDICIISGVNSSTGNCTVKYPAGGATNVFGATSTKTKTVAMTEFVEYQPSFKLQKLTTDETYVVYPTSAKSQNGTSWSLDPGDEYYTVAQASGLTEVLYYCTRGAHQGYWKLGWVDLPYYWIDLNGWLDGASAGDLGAYGAADVYVNGNLLAQNARDFYSANGTFPRGSIYEIKNIKAAGGYTYNGVHSGSASGKLKGNISVALDFTKDTATLGEIRLASKPSKVEYLEGESLNTSGLKVTAVYSDGTTSDVTSKCNLSGYTSTPGTKTIAVSYGGKTTAFTVVVKSKTPTKLAVTSVPTKTNYQVNDEVSLDGLKVMATFDNGTTAVVDDYEVMLEDGLTATAGTKTVTVVYAYNGTEVEASFDITVAEQTPDDPIEPPVPVDGPTLAVVADDQVEVGKTFDVKLSLTDNEGIASLKVKVAFDASLIELTNVAYTTNMGGMSQKPQKMTPPVTLNWFNGSDNYVGDATYATLTFKAVGSAGSKAKIELTYNPNDVYDIVENNIGLNIVNKTVTLSDGSTPDLKEGWYTFADGTKGYVRGGKLVRGWLDLDGGKYWFDQETGKMATGWTDLVVDGKAMHYYFRPSGNLARGAWADIDGRKYWFRASGNMATGWADIDGRKYWFDESGQMVTGWRDIDNGAGATNHYYFRPSGSMATGWAEIDGEYFYFRPSGNMATGFTDVTDDAYKRYFDEQGRMLTGWQQIGGNTYYFRSSGAMQTGTATIDGKPYAFSDKGVLVSGAAPIKLSAPASAEAAPDPDDEAAVDEELTADAGVAEPEADAVAESVAEPEVEVEADTEAVVEPETRVEDEPAAEPQPEVEAEAEPEPVASGQCGTCSWELGADGVLTIAPADGSEEGTLAEAPAASEEGDAPEGPADGPDPADTYGWLAPEVAPLVRKVRVLEGVRAPRSLAGALAGLEKLESADFSGLDLSALEDTTGLLDGCGALQRVTVADEAAATVLGVPAEVVELNER